MSSHRIMHEGREWMIGYDNPCKGFYATRFVPDDEYTDEEADVLIGFAQGVSLDELVAQCLNHGLTLETWMVATLARDKEREQRPLSPLQHRMRDLAAMFEEEV